MGSAVRCVSRPGRGGRSLRSSVGTGAVALLMICALLAGCGGTTLPAFIGTIPAGAAPAFSHVFVIVMENREYGSVIGSGDAPYINRLAATYGLASAYYATTHPSLPNYLSLLGGDTFGISSDCTDCFVSATNLVDSLEKAHKTWRAYMEGMPSPCHVADAYPYAQRHNPFVYFDDIRTNPARCGNVVPLTQLNGDLASAQPPAFMWITSDVCHDMHDCSTSTGDGWLASFVPTILESSAWKDRGVLFITWDEGDSNDGCCNGAAGGHVATLVISPLGKPHYRSVVPYDHYSLLRTMADGLEVTPPGKASADGTLPMNEFFSTGL